MRPSYAGFRMGAKASLRSNPVVLGRKFCASCGRWRLALDFSPMGRKGSKLSPYCRVCVARRHREQYRAPHSPEWWEQRREYQRIYQQTKRREAGIPERVWNRATVVDRLEYRFLPIGPLVAEIERHPDSYSVIARRAGTTERSVRRLVTGESAHVRLDLADRICFAMGTWLALVYGDTPLVSFEAPEAFQERWRRGTAA